MTGGKKKPAQTARPTGTRRRPAFWESYYEALIVLCYRLVMPKKKKRKLPKNNLSVLIAPPYPPAWIHGIVA